MRNVYFILLILCINGGVWVSAQLRVPAKADPNKDLPTLLENQLSNELRRCATMEKWAQQCEIQTEWASKLWEMSAKIKPNSSQYEKSDHLATIPIVVHILHNVESGEISGNNISEAQILSQIQRLNKDYGGLNEDLADVPVAFLPATATGTGIYFCLADTDPEGDPTNGITRTYTPQTNFYFEADDAKYDATGGKDAWDACQYLNIWVVPSLNQNTLLGYAQFPGGAPATDGVVVAHNYFGDDTGTANPTDSGPFYKGKTLTHEIGHFLGLFHPFENGCSIPGDLVDDTPFQASPTLGCPPAKFSCISPDMFVNFMDFANDECLLMFTHGQLARMQLFLETDPTRTCLLEATTTDCLLTTDLQAAFFAGDTVICEGETITFLDQSEGIPDTWSWEFEGGIPAAAAEPSASVTFSEAGTYTISLTIFDDSGNTDAETRVEYVTVLPEEDCLAEACAAFTPGDIPLGGPFTDLNPVPCGGSCGIPLVTDFEVASNQAYTLDNLIAGSAYNFNICNGVNAGSWEPVLTIADFTGSSVGEIVAFAVGCSLDFNVPSDGNYILVITEADICDGAPSNQLANGNLEVVCLATTACDCDVEIQDFSPMPPVCSNDLFTLELEGALGTIYENPIFVWMSSFDPGNDGLLGTTDDIFSGEPLPPNADGPFDYEFSTALVIGFGETLEFAYPNANCQPIKLYFYASVIDFDSFQVDVTGACHPYPYKEVIVTILPETQGFSIQEISECTFNFHPLCGGQVISPMSFTATEEVESLTIEVTGPCGQISEDIGFTACVVNSIAPQQVVTDTKADFSIQRLSPSPATHKMVLELMSPKASVLSLRIYHINGQLLSQQSVQTTGGIEWIDLDVTAYPAGLYLLQLAGEQGVIGKRFLVGTQ